MRYLTLAEALTVAEIVTGIPAGTLARSSRLDLLDSALHAPQAEFEGVEFYPGLISKAAVLVTRIARNHPLPDGNKRLAWQCLTLFCALNGHTLDVAVEEAVATMLSIAAGDVDESSTSDWIGEHLAPAS